MNSCPPRLTRSSLSGRAVSATTATTSTPESRSTVIGQLGNLRVESDADVGRKVNQEEVNGTRFNGPLQVVNGAAVELRTLPEPCWGMEP